MMTLIGVFLMIAFIGPLLKGIIMAGVAGIIVVGLLQLIIDMVKGNKS